MTQMNRGASATDRSLQTYRLYHRIIRKLLFFGGCLHSPTISRAFSYCSTGLVIFTCSAQTLLVFNFCYHHKDDLAIVMKSIGRATSAIIITTKAASFLLYRDDLMELDRTLNDLFEEELARGERIRMAVYSRLNEFHIPACVYPVVVAITILVWVGPAFANLMRQIAHLRMPMKYGLPFMGKYPWTVPENCLYHVHFLFENCIGWFFMFTTCGVDEAFGLYAYQISSVLRAMSVRLANPPADERFARLLRTCVEKHKLLLRCREHLERIYGPITLWMTLTNAVLMCSLIYEALPFTDFTFGKLMMLLSYLTLKLMQTFMYAWYGTIITSESENFRQGIYCSDWPDAVAERSVRPRIILTLMQKPMTIRALKICSVSVEMFVSVMNTTISYFFLLQTLDKRG